MNGQSLTVVIRSSNGAVLLENYILGAIIRTNPYIIGNASFWDSMTSERGISTVSIIGEAHLRSPSANSGPYDAHWAWVGLG